jgi:hypothetical protein
MSIGGGGFGGGEPYKTLRAKVTVTAISVSEEQGGARFPTVRIQTEDGRIVEKKLTDRLRDGIEVGDEVTLLQPSSHRAFPVEERRLSLSAGDSPPIFNRSCLTAMFVIVAIMIFGVFLWVVFFVLLANLFA